MSTTSSMGRWVVLSIAAIGAAFLALLALGIAEQLAGLDQSVWGRCVTAVVFCAGVAMAFARARFGVLFGAAFLVVAVVTNVTVALWDPWGTFSPPFSPGGLLASGSTANAGAGFAVAVLLVAGVRLRHLAKKEARE